MEFLDYAGNVVKTDACPGCDYANNRFSLPCGKVFENDVLGISQDWELSIHGFIILYSKRHIESLEELTSNERNQLFLFSSKCLEFLRGEGGVCKEYSVVFEEKIGRHFHIWLMPRLDFVQQLGATKNIGAVMDYAKKNLRTEDEFDKIEDVVCRLRASLKKKE